MVSSAIQGTQTVLDGRFPAMIEGMAFDFLLMCSDNQGFHLLSEPVQDLQEGRPRFLVYLPQGLVKNQNVALILGI
jgi:hypothetical protein